MHADMSVPVGHIEINPMEKLKRLTFGPVGGASKDHAIPAIGDLHLDSDEESQDSVSYSKPTFDHRSHVFELDPCDGYCKVCLVYKNVKLGVLSQLSEIWLLDRALRWHFLASSFMKYYCQTVIHLGLPQWQLSFTDMGLLPQAKQWFNLYCPTHLTDQPFDDLLAHTIDAEGSQMQQLDVARVFKGKSDKKKQPIGSQIIKKKPPLTSPLKPGSGKASTSSMQMNRTTLR
jgi:tubulin polyglutamylase complex subunit 2